MPTQTTNPYHHPSRSRSYFDTEQAQEIYRAFAQMSRTRGTQPMPITSSNTTNTNTTHFRITKASVRNFDYRTIDITPYVDILPTAGLSATRYAKIAFTVTNNNGRDCRDLCHVMQNIINYLTEMWVVRFFFKDKVTDWSISHPRYISTALEVLSYLRNHDSSLFDSEITSKRVGEFDEVIEIAQHIYALSNLGQIEEFLDTLSFQDVVPLAAMGSMLGVYETTSVAEVQSDGHSSIILCSSKASSMPKRLHSLFLTLAQYQPKKIECFNLFSTQESEAA